MMETKCAACNGTGKVKVSVLRQLRLIKGISQAAAADALGMTQSGYSKLEKRGPDWNMRYGLWQKLECYFRVSRAQLQGKASLPAPKTPRPARAPDSASLARSAAAKKAITAKNRRR